MYDSSSWNRYVNVALAPSSAICLIMKGSLLEDQGTDLGSLALAHVTMFQIGLTARHARCEPRSTIQKEHHSPQ